MRWSPDLHESVSAVFLSRGRVFAVERQPFLHAFPGYHSFPGGKIDQSDKSSTLDAALFEGMVPLHFSALCREIREELDFDLETAIRAGPVSGISPYAMAVAPRFAPVRFKTWFFRIDLQEPCEFKWTSEEFVAGYWTTPAELLEEYESGCALMVPPTRWVLEGLVQNPDARELGDITARYDETRFIPELSLLHGIHMLPVPSATLPPAQRTNAFLLGDENASRVLIDPSPESDAVFQRLLKTLADEPLNSLFLTHHHADHHQYANRLARTRDLPVLLSPDSYRRIVEKWGQDYFSGITVRLQREGDVLTSWHGEPVRVYQIPGHDEGHLGLAPDSMAWFLVGDLIQGIGTVVISAPEGDMAKYFSTLERVIGLAPRVIIPSHGIPMRGTHRLEETLAHRRERETAVTRLHGEGKTPREMVSELYRDVDSRLHPYALRNVRSHLKKLREEGSL